VLIVVVLQDEWLHEKQTQLQQLKDTYEKTVSCVGEGHRQAVGEQIVSWLHEEYVNWHLWLLVVLE